MYTHTHTSRTNQWMQDAPFDWSLMYIMWLASENSSVNPLGFVGCGPARTLSEMSKRVQFSKKTLLQF